jgi:MYXO-CTERM domain-containing protein
MHVIAALARAVPLAAAAAIAAAPHAAAAQPSADAAGDFLAGYVGPRSAELDVVAVDFLWNGGDTFTLFSRSAGAVGQTPGALFVWGVDRGQGSVGFPGIAPGVRFDAVVAVNPLGATTVRDLVSGQATTLAAGAVRFAGADLFVDVPAALLPTRGLAPGAYTANLWPRVGAGNNNQISDFAPDNSNILVTTTPEPAAAALLLPALGVAAAAAARRRRSA